MSHVTTAASPGAISAVRAAKASIQQSTINPSMVYGTNGLGYSLPNEFMLDAIDKQVLLKRIKIIYRDAIQGEFDKLVVGRHIMQGKVEGEAVKSTGISVSKVQYAMKYTSSLWDFTREALDANIARERLAQQTLIRYAEQYGLDTADLGLNGDESIVLPVPEGASADEKAEIATAQAFYRINDGWLKQAEASGNVIADQRVISWDLMHDIYSAMPSRYMSSERCWIMSPWLYNEWHRYATNSANSGGNISMELVNKPMNFEIIQEPMMPNNKILLADPTNLVMVTNRQPVFMSTSEGKDAIQRNVTYHAIHSCSDFVIQEPKALVIATNVSPAVS